MTGTARTRLAGLLLPLLVGVVGAVGYAVSKRFDNAASTASGPNGTGTVRGPSAGPSAGPRNGSGRSGVFSIEGPVGGLVPGAGTGLPLTISNPNPWPIQVLTITTGVGTPNGSPCPAHTLSVGDYTYATGGSVYRAAAHGTVQIVVPVLLADSTTLDQSGCPGATFPLTFAGTAQMVAGR